MCNVFKPYLHKNNAQTSLGLSMETRRHEIFCMGPPEWSDNSDSEHKNTTDMTDEQIPADLLQVFLADDTPLHMPMQLPQATVIHSTS